MPDQASLEQRLIALEAEVGRLTAVDQIKQLMNKYGYMLDKCYYDEIPDLFVPESVATPEIYHDGSYFEGAAGVRRFYDFFKRRHAAGANGPAPREFVDHPYMQHVVTVLDGNESALSRSRVLVQMVRHKDHEQGPLQLWGAGIYENEYRRVDGLWMFRKLNLSIYWATLFDEGWAMVTERPAQPPMLYPDDPLGPDRLVDHGAPSWPASTATFPFHFAHPTTGKAITVLPAGQDRLPPIR
jgi:carotenoid cleavage dioxygenase